VRKYGSALLPHRNSDGNRRNNTIVRDQLFGLILGLASLLQFEYFLQLDSEKLRLLESVHCPNEKPTKDRG